MRKPVRFGLRSAMSLLFVSLVSFAVVTSMSADPVDIAIRAWNLPATEQTIAAIRAEWGLDHPFLLRYVEWLSDFVIGDWGRSFRTGEPVLSEFATRLPLSLSLGLTGLAIAVIIAIPLGFLAALTPGGIANGISRCLSVFAQAVPSFWFGLVLMWLLGVYLRWIRPFATDWISFLLPIGLIALHSIAVFARVYRRDLLETTKQPYFRTAIAKGLSHRQALWRHGHQSAVYALVSTARSEAGWVIGSTATMEILFGLSGITQFLVQSIASRDQMVLQAYVMVIAIWMLVMNAIAQLIMGILDPRT